MDRVSRGFRTKRIFALMLVCIMAVSFMPVLGGQAHSATNYCNVTYNQAAGTVTVQGSVKGTRGDYFLAVFVDSDGSIMPFSGSSKDTTINTTFSIKNCSVGYHTIYVWTKSSYDRGEPYKIQEYVPRGIFSKPTNSAKRYAAYSRYFDFYTGFDNYSDYYSYDLYVDYKIRGTKNWKRSGRMGLVGQTYKVNGLTPNRYYQARTHFGKWVTYKGKNYFFTSLSTGNGSPIVTFRSGKANKPKIKSVKVKAIKVKKKRGTRYGYYTGLPLGKFTYYKYKIKVTVKLKKRPGTKGIVINGKRFKGNKKKYTFTLGPYTNYTKPKGKKFTVYAYTYDSKTYGGYSPMYKKKKKVR